MLLTKAWPECFGIIRTVILLSLSTVAILIFPKYHAYPVATKPITHESAAHLEIDRYDEERTIGHDHAPANHHTITRKMALTTLSIMGGKMLLTASSIARIFDSEISMFFGGKVRETVILPLLAEILAFSPLNCA